MQSYLYFLLFLAVYIIFLITCGLYFNRRSTTQEEFWLAGRSAGAISVGFSAAASWLTAGGILAVVGFYMLLGMGSIWDFVAPNVLALIIIALFVKKIRSLPAMTQPELLEMRYGSSLRLPVASIITVVMILFAISDIKGFSMVLQVFYGVSELHAALIVGLAVAVYVTLGGFSAVLATDVVQFICLALFVLIMAFAVPAGAGDVSGVTVGQMVSEMPSGWWNPAVVGLPAIVILLVAVIPGWITEQDPWQRVWAAKDDRTARNGMLLGAVLVALVFAGCAFIAVGLDRIYPEIVSEGFPAGMGKAEPALLQYIMDIHLPAPLLALAAVALATAAMSCTDTFAASGASCIARDIFRGTFCPNATTGQMQLVSRISVLLIVALAIVGSFFINSVLDAIHIATYIASASYFFVLMGGLFWKRASAVGAKASLCTGFVVQAGLIIVDLAGTEPMGTSYLETVSPLLVEHGVIAAMVASGLVFIVVSLLTPQKKVPSL